MRAMVEAYRPHAGIQVELLAQVELRRDLGSPGPADIGQAHSAKQNRVAIAAGLHCGRRQRIAGAKIFAGAGGIFVQVESDAVEFRFHGPQNTHSLRDYFRSNAVAGKDNNTKYGHADIQLKHAGRHAADDR